MVHGKNNIVSMTNPHRRLTRLATLLVLFLASVLSGNVVAAKLGDGIIEPGENSSEELARAVQNPIASQINVPFQNNSKFDVGHQKKTQNVLNILPILPFKLNEDWNLIPLTSLSFLFQ